MLLGVAIGLQIVGSYRYIEEAMPQQVFGIFASILFFMTIAGAFLAMIVSSILPADAHKRELEDHEIWKAFGGAFVHIQQLPDVGK